jgi:hypothetical protein
LRVAANSDGRQRTKSNVVALVAEDRLVDAQLRHDGSLTDDDDEFDAIVDRAVEKERQIFKRILKVKPTDRYEVRLLLELALDFMRDTRSEQWPIDIIQQAATALGSIEIEKSAER